MKAKDSKLRPINFDQLVAESKEKCSDSIANIGSKLNSLNKLEIISRLSILTQTQIGRECLEDYHISDTPCLQFITGLALKNESCSDVEPSVQDIYEILDSLKIYFLNFHLSLIPFSRKKEKNDDIIFHAQMHALIGQLNPEKYPFQMVELLTGTFSHLDDFFTANYGFTVNDAIEFSQKIIQQYENSINLKKEQVQNKKIEDEEKLIEFYSKTRDVLEIIPEDFCKTNSYDKNKFQKYLQAFSCGFGEGIPCYNSPLDENLFLKKPILHQNGHFFAPVPQDLFQKLPSMLEDLLEQEKQQSTKTWQKYQETKSKFTEKKVTEYLSRVFKKEEVHENLFYTIEKGKTAEVDHIIQYCNNVLIIESKSGNFSITAKQAGVKRITTNLKRLVCAAHDQGLRVREFIKKENIAKFVNSNGKPELEIGYTKNKTNFILINVTLEPLLSFSSSLKNIESLGLFSHSEYPWSVNLFELDIITRLIDSPAIFIHYIQRRLKAQDENLFSTFDELTFLGFYLEWGNFNIYLEDGSKPDKIHLDTEFLEEFDQHYLYGGDPPQFKIETEIRDIIRELEQLQPEGFTNLTNTLLDLDHQTRETIIKSLKKICDMSKDDGKKHDFSLMTKYNKIGITCFSLQGKENLFELLSSFCSLKKYQCQADRWIGLGIDILDSKYLIHAYYFEESKWKRDRYMDQTIKLALNKGLIQKKCDKKF